MILKPKARLAGIYLLRVFIFCLFCALGAVPFFVIIDYLNQLQANNAMVYMQVVLAKGLIVSLGVQYMLIGVWVGWKLRTHSIYNDILDIDTMPKYIELKSAVLEHGRANGWEK